MHFCATWSRWPWFSTAIGLNDPRSSLASPTILWSCRVRNARELGATAEYSQDILELILTSNVYNFKCTEEIQTLSWCNSPMNIPLCQYIFVLYWKAVTMRIESISRLVYIEHPFDIGVVSCVSRKTTCSWLTALIHTQTPLKSFQTKLYASGTNITYPVSTGHV